MKALKGLWPGLMVGLAAMVVLTAGPAAATPLPPGVAAMIDAAANDPATLKTVVTVAKKANPGSTAEIDAQVAALGEKSAAAKAERLATQSIYQGWTGKGQVGLYSHSGNTNDGGIAVGLNLDKDGLRWRHIVSFLADYQQENGKPTKEKYSAGYEADYKFTKRFYGYGVLYGEQDIFASIQSRFSESLGVGYRVIDRKTMTLGLEAGPAIRQTAYIGAPSLDTVDIRLAGNFSWTFWDNTTFTQTAWTYLEHRNPTLNASTALTTKLQKGISARASFDVTHEGDPAPGRERTDTTSRLTLVFNF